MKKPIFVVTALLAFCLSANSLFAQTAPAAAPAGSGDIVAAMTSSDTYNAFSIAIRAAGINTQLEGAGPFTVFAPTNDAYAKTPSTRLDAGGGGPAARGARGGAGGGGGGGAGAGGRAGGRGGPGGD